MFERVYTMTDYYDGPRGGIASFRGAPHAYVSRWAEGKDDWEDFYELRPVDDETLRLALESWEIWLRWEEAFHAGLTTLETHPALPVDRARHTSSRRSSRRASPHHRSQRCERVRSFARLRVTKARGAAAGWKCNGRSSSEAIPERETSARAPAFARSRGSAPPPSRFQFRLSRIALRR